MSAAVPALETGQKVLLQLGDCASPVSAQLHSPVPLQVQQVVPALSMDTVEDMFRVGALHETKQDPVALISVLPMSDMGSTDSPLVVSYRTGSQAHPAKTGNQAEAKYAGNDADLQHILSPRAGHSHRVESAGLASRGLVTATAGHTRN